MKQGEQAQVEGTVVSVRGGIYQVRPSLRPRLMRLSVSSKTEFISYHRVDKNYLKVGMRAECGGFYNPKDGLTPFYVEASVRPLGPLKTLRAFEVMPDGTWANLTGTIESLSPLMIKDGAGKSWTLPTERLRNVKEIRVADRRALLIGTRFNASGPLAPDGVLQAELITIDLDYSASGTMFGRILSVELRQKVLTIQPRYTRDRITVRLKPGVILLREIKLDPDSLKIGSAVTVWGQRLPGRSELATLALLIGPGRYPSAAGRDDAPIYLSGVLRQLEPDVVLQLPGGERRTVLIPAQLPIARLESVGPVALKPGMEALLVLEPQGNDFSCGTVIVDASPWVGYGG